MNKNLNIYLLKRFQKNFKSYIDHKYQGKLRVHLINKSKFKNVERGIIYIYDPPDEDNKRPEWQNHLEGVSEKKKLVFKKKRSASSSILFLTIKAPNNTKHTFALVFGSGAFLLEREEIAHDFGLKVSKSLLIRSELISVDSTLLDKRISNTRKQSTAFLLPEKILDPNTQSILKKLHGRYKKADKVFFIGGRSSLNLRGEIDLSRDITNWLLEFIEVYLEEKNNLGIEDSLIAVSDEKKKLLDEKLGEKILKIIESKPIDGRQVSGLRIIPQTLFNVDKFYGFFIEGLGYKSLSVSSEFFIEEVNFFNRLESKLKPNQRSKDGIITKLKHTNISIKEEDKPQDNEVEIKQEDDNEAEIKTRKLCSVYQAINYEVTLNKKKYSLLDGTWYEIEKDFYELLCKEVNNISPPDLSKNQKQINFIDFKESRDYRYIKDKKGNQKKILSEGKYNENLAKYNNILLMDQKNFTPDKETIKNYGIKGKIEVCDLFSCDENYVQFIHVKRHSGGAAGTSHLLAQAIVSANCFINDQESVEKFINEHIEKSNSNDAIDYAVPTISYNEQRKEIILAIVDEKYNSNKKNSEIFSLLEMINLKESVKNLRFLGFDCYLKFIKTAK